MKHRKVRTAAEKSGKASKNAESPTPASLCETGLTHFRAGRFLDAQMCGEKALAQEPNHADSLNLMGIVSMEAQQYDIALEFMAAAIRQDPKPAYLTTLGVLLIKQGRNDEGLKAFDKAVQLKPDDAVLWKNLGNVLEKLDRPHDALLSFQHALTLDPQYWNAADRSGHLLHKLKRYEEALAQFNLCDDLRPDFAPTLQMRGVVLRDLRRLEEALVSNRRAVELDPANAAICNNLGDVLLLLGELEDAMTWFDKALSINRDHVPALKNKAFTLGQMRRFDEAFAYYDRLKKIVPDDADAKWNLALFQMVLGNFEEGLVGREARWEALFSAYPKFSQPRWLGKEPVEGKTVLVLTDEGLGDSIQFARYVPMLAERGARVILTVQDAVYPLLSAMPGVAECRPISAGEPTEFDLHCPMCSLPLAFGTTLDTIPAQTTYLPPPLPALVQAWQDRLRSHPGSQDKLRVGLVWSGNPVHANDRNRSLPLQTLLPLLEADATFISLQKNPRASDQAVLEQTGILDLTGNLTDFSETAALVSCLDLVITVDTSVAHLAAAMGRPTWIMLPYMPDFRWLLDREDSPWYPTVRLFRQTDTRDYGEVVDRLGAALRKFAAAR